MYLFESIVTNSNIATTSHIASPIKADPAVCLHYLKATSHILDCARHEQYPKYKYNARFSQAIEFIASHEHRMHHHRHHTHIDSNFYFLCQLIHFDVLCTAATHERGAHEFTRGPRTRLCVSAYNRRYAPISRVLPGGKSMTELWVQPKFVAVVVAVSARPRSVLFHFVSMYYILANAGHTFIMKKKKQRGQQAADKKCRK